MARTSRNRGKNVAGSSNPDANQPGDEQDVPNINQGRSKRARTSSQAQKPAKKSSRKDRYEKLLKMKFRQTRWADHQTLRELGIFEDVSEILGRIGLLGLFHMSHLAYEDETVEFFATLKVEDDTSLDISDENRGRISFRAGGRPFRATFAQIGAALHLRPGGDVYTLSLDWKEAQGIWSEIAHGSYTKGTSKASTIRNPAIRYVHKFLANTLFARRETGAVKEDELALIIEGIKPILRTTIMNGEIIGQTKQLNLAHYFVRRLQAFQDWCINHNDNTPEIHIGGLLTPIFLACNVPLQGIERSVRPLLLDMKHLCLTKFIRGRVKRSYAYEFYYTSTEKQILLLPSLQVTRVNERANIIFKPRIFLLHDPLRDGTVKNLRGPIGEDNEDDEMEPPAEILGSERYKFKPYSGPVSGEALQKAHEHIGILYRAFKWQKKHIKKLCRTGKKQAKLIKELFARLGQTPEPCREMTVSEHQDEAGPSSEPRRRKGKEPIPVSSSSSDSDNPCYDIDDDSDDST